LTDYVTMAIVSLVSTELARRGGEMAISANMFGEMANVKAWELHGYLGCPACHIPSRTRWALDRRGLIAPNVDGSYKLTQLGEACLVGYLLAGSTPRPSAV
jgi:hypothetical protein